MNKDQSPEGVRELQEYWIYRDEPFGEFFICPYSEPKPEGFFNPIHVREVLPESPGIKSAEGDDALVDADDLLELRKAADAIDDYQGNDPRKINSLQTALLNAAWALFPLDKDLEYKPIRYVSPRSEPESLDASSKNTRSIYQNSFDEAAAVKRACRENYLDEYDAALIKADPRLLMGRVEYVKGAREQHPISVEQTLRSDVVMGLRQACDQALLQWEMYCTALSYDDLEKLDHCEADKLLECKALLAAFDKEVK